MGILNRIRQSGKPDVVSEPLSVTGRGHVDGFLNLEELNVDLQGRQGLEIYDRMYRTDSDVSQVIMLTAGPIMAGTWEVEPAGGAQATDDALKDAAFVRWALFENMQPTLRGHLREALPVLFRSGFVPFEKVWEVTDYQGSSVTVIRSLQLRLPRTIYRWKQDVWGGLEAIEQYLPVPKAQVVAGPNVIIPGNPVLTSGPDDTTKTDDSSITDASIITDTRMPDYRQTVWIPMSNLVYYRVGAEGDNWEGVSMLRPCYKNWLFKDAIERMDALAQEHEALGIPVCYPPLGATQDQFDAMEQVLSGIRSNAQGYVLMPGPKASGTSSGAQFGNGWLLEWLTPGQHGTGRDPQPALKYHTDKIAAAFIAEFIRLGHSLTGGNKGLGSTQRDPFLVGVEAIAGLIEDIINDQVVAPLVAYNRPNAKSAPRVKMSLVDATALTELADFILKLVQVGAMLPDQTLEDFLRARADLPPSDSHATAERGELDNALRREIIIGKNKGGGDAAGTNGAAGSSTGGSAPNTKGTDNKEKATSGAPSPPASAHDALMRKAIAGAQLARDDSGNPSAVDYPSGSADDFERPPFSPGTQRIRWRPQAFYELGVNLDGIEDHFDSAPDRMIQNCGMTMTQLARKMADEYPKRTTGDHNLQGQIHRILDDAYGFGRQTISQEIESHVQDDGYQLAVDDAVRRSQGIEHRAVLGTAHVLDSMHHAIGHAHLQGHGAAEKQGAAEKAGRAALKQVARSHVVHAFNMGREQTLLDAADGDSGTTWGVRYTAILDNNTCDHCRAADDGVVRALDDPVRLANKPPNPNCESLESGRGNQCRCFEIPEITNGAADS